MLLFKLEIFNAVLFAVLGRNYCPKVEKLTTLIGVFAIVLIVVKPVCVASVEYKLCNGISFC